MAKRLAIAWLTAVGLWVALPGAAQAAFPGANGKIVYLRVGGPLFNDAALVAQSPRGGDRVVLRRGAIGGLGSRHAVAASGRASLAQSDDQRA